jgi:hypothetical protein
VRWSFAALVGAAAIAIAVAVASLVRSQGPSEAAAFPDAPMPGRLLVGLQDDASFRWAPDRAESLDVARGARVSVIRTIVEWRHVAPTRPSRPSDSFDPAYRLDDVDDLVRSAQQRGIEILVTIWGTPEWANGGAGPNVPPRDSADFRAFAQALADRYSGRHPGFPAVRLFSIWNEPNLEQFLSPQFDDGGRSVSPILYAELVRAGYAGIERGNPDALVAIGETSPHGNDRPSLGPVQDSHSPVRFARLLSEIRPRVPLDAWAQHPYPTRHTTAPAAPARWPRVSLSNLERFGLSLDEWFGARGLPIWVTEYGHETRPVDPTGVDPETQARYVTEALGLAAGNPRVRLFAWFILRDRALEPWQSGLVAAGGTPKPGLARFRAAATVLDPRNPVVTDDAEVARVPALELAYHTPAGALIEIRVEGGARLTVPLGPDGWLEVPLADLPAASSVALEATNRHGLSVSRTLAIVPASVEAE